MKTVAWNEGAVELLDQTCLPETVVRLRLVDPKEVIEAITAMRVRGAPAIGVAAAMAMALAANKAKAQTGAELAVAIESTAQDLINSRPTAVNLAWAVRRMLACARDRAHLAPEELRRYLELEAQVMAQDDIVINRALGQNGVSLFPDEGSVLTICSTGSLATVEFGTALGTIRSAIAAGKKLHVWVCETRPRFQGARLNAWELQQDSIPFTVITDSMAAHVMRKKGVDLVITGADRVAANGDTANKIGTYSLAVLAHHHRIPFYVAAPTSTIDPQTPSGEIVVIEERDPQEITHVLGQRVVVDGAAVYNPAFDVTPAELITGIVTERGVLRPPYSLAIERLLG